MLKRLQRLESNIGRNLGGGEKVAFVGLLASKDKDIILENRQVAADFLITLYI